MIFFVVNFNVINFYVNIFINIKIYFDISDESPEVVTINHSLDDPCSELPDETDLPVFNDDEVEEFRYATHKEIFLKSY